MSGESKGSGRAVTQSCRRTWLVRAVFRRHNVPVSADDERFEQLIAFLGSQLPTPVEQQSEDDGSLIFIGGSPGEVVVHLASSKITVSEYAGEWEPAGRFTIKPRRVGTLIWQRLPETPLVNALSALIKGARDMRHARYQPCAVCGEKQPPELLFDDGVCSACSEPQPYRVH